MSAVLAGVDKRTRTRLFAALRSEFAAGSPVGL